jgi:hypothetical protein
MEEDFEVDYDAQCPECNHSPIHYRTCQNWCEDGWIDDYDDDPINCPIPGLEFTRCDECRGTGIETWCPNCGENLSGIKIHDEEEAD